MQFKKQQLEQNMEKLTRSKLGKEYKALYCHPVYFTYMYTMQNAELDELSAGLKIARRNIYNLRYADEITSMAVKEE